MEVKGWSVGDVSSGWTPPLSSLLSHKGFKVQHSNFLLHHRINIEPGHWDWAPLNLPEPYNRNDVVIDDTHPSGYQTTRY